MSPGPAPSPGSPAPAEQAHTGPDGPHIPRPLEVPEPIGDPRADALRKLVAIVDRLREPDGCPWDREQTLETLAPHLIEEAHELQEAIERGDHEHAAEEAGDLLMGVTLVARVAEEAGRFDLADVAQGVSGKLVRRHPHVFGGAEAESADAALANWEAVKRAERREKSADASALDGVPVALPALQRARRLGQKAVSAGFRWTSAAGALAKLAEEVEELHETLGGGAGEFEAKDLDEGQRDAVERELGDVLMAGAFLGGYLDVDPERATRRALRRFEARYRRMEIELGGELQGRPLAELMDAWERAKAAESESAE